MTGFYNHDTPPRNIPLCIYKHSIGCIAHKQKVTKLGLLFSRPCPEKINPSSPPPHGLFNK